MTYDDYLAEQDRLAAEEEEQFEEARNLKILIPPTDPWEYLKDG